MAELLYVDHQIEHLKMKKAGIIANPDDWTDTDITAVSVQSKIDVLELAKKIVLDNEVVLHNSRLAARKAAEVGKVDDDLLVLKVKGRYAANTEKWAEYGVDAHDAITSKKEAAVPAKGMIKSIEDGPDAEGFIIKGKAIQLVDVYEWQKGVGSIADANIIPVFVHLITNKKCKIIDDDVQKGIRYFYRYRAYNAHGFGEWSEPVSKIQ